MNLLSLIIENGAWTKSLFPLSESVLVVIFGFPALELVGLDIKVIGKVQKMTFSGHFPDIQTAPLQKWRPSLKQYVLVAARQFWFHFRIPRPRKRRKGYLDHPWIF